MKKAILALVMGLALVGCSGGEASTRISSPSATVTPASEAATPITTKAPATTVAAIDAKAPTSSQSAGSGALPALVACDGNSGDLALVPLDGSEPTFRKGPSLAIEPGARIGGTENDPGLGRSRDRGELGTYNGFCARAAEFFDNRFERAPVVFDGAGEKTDSLWILDNGLDNLAHLVFAYEPLTDFGAVLATIKAVAVSPDGTKVAWRERPDQATSCSSYIADLPPIGSEFSILADPFEDRESFLIGTSGSCSADQVLWSNGTPWFCGGVGPCDDGNEGEMSNRDLGYWTALWRGDGMPSSSVWESVGFGFASQFDDSGDQAFIAKNIEGAYMSLFLWPSGGDPVEFAQLPTQLPQFGELDFPKSPANWRLSGYAS